MDEPRIRILLHESAKTLSMVVRLLSWVVGFVLGFECCALNLVTLLLCVVLLCQCVVFCVTVGFGIFSVRGPYVGVLS